MVVGGGAHWVAIIGFEVVVVFVVVDVVGFSVDVVVCVHMIVSVSLSVYLCLSDVFVFFVFFLVSLFAWFLSFRHSLVICLALFVCWFLSSGESFCPSFCLSYADCTKPANMRCEMTSSEL